jgi:hypothetical protein
MIPPNTQEEKIDMLLSRRERLKRSIEGATHPANVNGWSRLLDGYNIVVNVADDNTGIINDKHCGWTRLLDDVK